MNNIFSKTYKVFQKKLMETLLAEFATTTSLMATLAATAAPKMSELSESAKGEKSQMK